MKKTNYILCSFLLVCFLGTSAVIAGSITDPTDDVGHYMNTTTGWGWAYDIGSKPDIDITEMKSTISGDQITLELIVDGTIQTNKLIYYAAWYNTSDAYYWMSWNSGTGGGFAVNTAGGMQMSQTEVTASGDTISATFDLVGEDTTAERFWGYAWEYTTFGMTTNVEWWGDWIPNDESPFYDDYQNEGPGDDDNDSGDTGQNGDDTDDGETGDQSDQDNNPSNPSGTPGFELLFVILALMISIIVRKKST